MSHKMTREGLKALEEELEDLRTRGRQEIAEAIKEARGFGDLSENAEYDAAKQEQGLMEQRIVMLEDRVRNAEIVDKIKKTGVIDFGSRVKLKNQKTKKETEITLVGLAESDIVQGKMSTSSPVAKALMGQKEGDVVSVQAPGGKWDAKILKVTQ